jgi:hypothetical protein
MAIQLRNTIFDPLDAGLLAELAAVLTALTPVAFTKHAPSTGRQDSHVYEGVGPNFILRIEVPYAKATVAAIAALEGAISGVGAILLLEEDGWNAGSDADLRE